MSFLYNFNKKINLPNHFQSKFKSIYSHYLDKQISLHFIQSNIKYINNECSLILMNDGQDVEQIDVLNTLNELIQLYVLKPILLVAICTNEDRIKDYGTAYSADFAGRGNRAGLYNKFVMDELIPFIKKETQLNSFLEKSFIGWSLGALSALDIVWNNAHQFNKVGLFSPSLWWRRKSYLNGYTDENDRLMHLQIKFGEVKPWMQLFIECGALDESSDRNKNGIIDSIDDALDLIKLLKSIGFKNHQIHYIELADGKHDLPTWKKVFPLFIKWGYLKKSIND